MVHLHRSGKFSRWNQEPQALWDDKPAYKAAAPNWDMTLDWPPLFFWRKKTNITGHGDYTHILHQHIHTVPCVNTLCMHQHGSSPVHEPVTVIQPELTHTHTWHSHTLFVKTYKTVQTLQIHEQKQRHMRKFHLIVSKAPFSQSNQWFITRG